MDSALVERIDRACKHHPKPEELNFSYGTAGFRTKAHTLDSVVCRMGILAVLRSKALSGKAIGIMITASHNPIEDNGVKLVDPLGEMLEASWEGFASRIANEGDSSLCELLQQIIKEQKIDMTQTGNVIVARDTRPSGTDLLASVKDGAGAFQEKLTDCGLQTTPQLHYIVRCLNTNESYGKPSEEGYYEKLSTAFRKVRDLSGRTTSCCVKVDGANGIGAMQMRKLLVHLGDCQTAEIYNDGTTGELNKQCGADYVKMHQAAPVGFPYSPGDRCISFDGDADRIVYFFQDAGGKFHLLDGDKIATLIASYLKEKIDLVGIQLTKGLGVVQTAYANGSSTRYLKDFMKVPVACTKTGVKHLHKQAEEDFDIGVYFEANGHGTVVYSSAAEQMIRDAAKNSSSDSATGKAALVLEAVMDMINQAVGDAISILLVVESILQEKQWGCEDWNKCYDDLPNRQKKVQVKDRTVIETADAERKVVKPDGFQKKLDSIVCQFPQGRSFVRPSGTEDVVRVYAESKTKDATEYLAAAVSALVYDHCGGIGQYPDVPAQPNSQQ